MEHKIHQDNTNEEKKALIKSWLYRLLSEIEVSSIDEAKETETGHTIIIEVTFKGRE